MKQAYTPPYHRTFRDTIQMLAVPDPFPMMDSILTVDIIENEVRLMGGAIVVDCSVQTKVGRGLTTSTTDQ